MTAQGSSMNQAFSAPENDHERFLYSVSHDLQEPLRMVSSFLKLLEAKAGDRLDDDARQYLQFSVENAERMKRMIHALVDLSRVNRDTEAAEAVDLREIARELVCMLSGLGSDGRAELIAPDAISVFMAPGQAVQLMRILFQNAFDNRPENEVLQLHLTGQQHPDGTVEVALKDNGQGLPEGFIHAAFELFRKKDRSSANIGAGLTIARTIVERYGGQIQLNNSETNGTVVSFRLPTTGG